MLNESQLARAIKKGCRDTVSLTECPVCAESIDDLGLSTADMLKHVAEELLELSFEAIDFPEDFEGSDAGSVNVNEYGLSLNSRAMSEEDSHDPEEETIMKHEQGSGGPETSSSALTEDRLQSVSLLFMLMRRCLIGLSSPAPRLRRSTTKPSARMGRSFWLIQFRTCKVELTANLRRCDSKASSSEVPEMGGLPYYLQNRDDRPQ